MLPLVPAPSQGLADLAVRVCVYRHSLDSFVGKSCAEQEKCKVPPKLNGS